MKWDQGHRSDDLIDKRGERMGPSGGGLGGVMALAPLLLRTKYGWVILLLLLGVGFFKSQFLSGQSSSPATGNTGTATRVLDEQAQFVGFVLDDIQSTWDKILTGDPVKYRHAKLVLFTDRTATGCGTGEAATGPFYCPADERAYIDLGFYAELANRLGAKGDFAQAYVLAHEIGHHVQTVLGVSKKVTSASKAQAKGETGLLVRQELQADCFAGIWAKATEGRNLVEAGDIDEALEAAASVGDDRLQKQAGGVVNPESWSHGSSAMRARWFRVGYQGGTLAACDTFSAPTL